MRDALDNFAQKRLEVELYFGFLGRTQSLDASLSASDKADGAAYTEPLSPEIKTILKASAFLILYNLVESTVRDGIRAVFNSIRGDSLTYGQIRADIQKLWILSNYSKLELSRAGHDKYVDIAKAIVDEVITGPVVAFSADYDCGISGNLDAAKIRELADRYGFSYDTRAEAKGGSELRTVKDRRNALAHGSLSFITCGREYEFTRLSEIKDQVLVYLEDILSNIQTYVDTGEYKS